MGPFDRPLTVDDPANPPDVARTYRADGQVRLLSRPDGDHIEQELSLETTTVRRFVFGG